MRSVASDIGERCRTERYQRDVKAKLFRAFATIALISAAIADATVHSWGKISLQPSSEPSVGGAESRVYLMDGLGDERTSSAVDDVGSKIKGRDPDAVVMLANGHEWRTLTADAAQHPDDQIVITGYTMGSKSAGIVAEELAERGT